MKWTWVNNCGSRLKEENGGDVRFKVVHINK